jgi:aspartyl-tRNA(Asn)/glutamyl-tRNA(Gln) amidotransferase subunit C
MAKLARLNFPEEELSKYAKKAEAVIAYIEKLSELDTEGVDPTSHVVDKEAKSQPLREDGVKRWEKPDDIIGDAPEVEGPFVQVPRVIE